MYIFEVLNKIKETGICVRPFTNYDASNNTERHETGAHFKSTDNEWPVSKVEFTKAGNLNLKFFIDGHLKVNENQSYPCKEIRNISIVQNGELKLQYLQVTKDKDQQDRLRAQGIEVKNNIVDLSKYKLTDHENIRLDDMVKTIVHNKLKELKTVKSPKPTRVKSQQELILETLGLKDGYYTAPVKKITTVIPNSQCTIKIDKLSTNSTKLAKQLKELNIQVEPVDLNRMIYDAKCQNVHGAMDFSYRLTNDITITGSVSM